ncbi:hypothetical protein [Rhodococcus maanshanensis]|uniref:hypothetical protein n=1 Tax=Rhodococcus maanshanensis TaxID=183556 RepID=UPI000AED7A25|nr:hypothetical protein [Rhodococcus maanshanensis]
MLHLAAVGSIPARRSATGGTIEVVSDVGDLTAVVTEIESRLANEQVDDQDRESLLHDRDRATLFLAAVRSGRRELIRQDLYFDILERYPAQAQGRHDEP